MKLVLQRDLIKGVYKKWVYQYPIGGAHVDDSKNKIALKLLELDLSIATAKQVDEIIGNNSWTTERCDECGERKENYLLLGDEDKGDHVFILCSDCAKNIAKVFK